MKKKIDYQKYFISPMKEHEINSCKKSGLITIEIERLSPKGILLKLEEWQKDFKDVEGVIYDCCKYELRKHGIEIPKHIIRCDNF